MNDMTRRYIVTGNWYDKVTKKPVSGMAEITKGISKETNKPYEMLQTDKREAPIAGTYEVGTVFVATFSVAQDSPSKTPLNLKSGNQ